MCPNLLHILIIQIVDFLFVGYLTGRSFGMVIAKRIIYIYNKDTGKEYKEYK
jgi:hypothetical protein